INHELLAEVALAQVYSLFSGPGVLLLKIAIGILTLWFCWRGSQRKLAWPERAWAWVFAAVAVVEISFGFAARPQIFTALFLAIELLLIQKILEQKFVVP